MMRQIIQRLIQHLNAARERGSVDGSSLNGKGVGSGKTRVSVRQVLEIGPESAGKDKNSCHSSY
jgi:hypothetical protein